jgi:hypothetical protein
MSFDKIVPVIVEHQLRFELIDSTGVCEIVDFKQVFDLLNLAPKNPVEVMKALLKLKLGFNRIYIYYREQHERSKLELYNYEYQMQDKYSRKDTSNPLHGEKKLTIAAIEAAIKKEEDWKALNDAVKEIESYKMQIGACKDIIEQTLVAAQHFISNPLEVEMPFSDNAEDLKKISSLASKLTEEDAF